ncbi:MAG: DinB family protein [Bacteroidia bacterium]|nr:DinB family protein [Bacteroidia bacterium]
MNNADFISETLREGKNISEAVAQKFGNLSPELQNTRPAPDKWSIGQCLDHLIVLNSTYFEVLSQLEAGTYQPSFWAKISPFSGMFGNMLIKSIDPQNITKVKTQPVWEPSQSNVSEDIVSRFLSNHEILMNKLGKLTAVNLNKTIISSPAAGFITYSLYSLYKILILHEKRHILQAENVLKTISDANKR